MKLVNNHSSYKNIVKIDQQNFDKLQEDAFVSDRLTQIPVTSNLQSNDIHQYQTFELLNDSVDLKDHTAAPCLHIPNIRQEVDQIYEIDRLDVTLQNVQRNETVLLFPPISFDPLNEFTTPGYIACAFPCLFPTGI